MLKYFQEDTVTLATEDAILMPIKFDCGTDYHVSSHNHPKLRQDRKYHMLLAEYNLIFTKDTKLKTGIAAAKSCLAFGIYFLTDGEEKFSIGFRHEVPPEIVKEECTATHAKIICRTLLDSPELGKGKGYMTVLFPISSDPNMKVVNIWNFSSSIRN